MKIKELHIVVAVIVVLIAIPIVTTFLAVLENRQKLYDQKRLQEQQVLTTQNFVNQTASLFDEDELFVSKMETTPKDPWGTTITIAIEGEAIKTCTVKSAGPDTKFNSTDDIVAINRNVSVKSVGSSVGKTTGEFGIGVVKGVINAVKDEFKK